MGDVVRACHEELTGDPGDRRGGLLPNFGRDEGVTFTFAKRCSADGLSVTPMVFPAVP